MIVQHDVIAYETAATALQGAIAHLRAEGVDASVAVVDPSGHPIALARLDGAGVTSTDYALDKAFTAATSGCATETLFSVMDAVPALRLGLANRPRLLVWGGGQPLFHGGRVVGGIGVSGGTEAQDAAAAAAGALAAGLTTTA
jgi:uncharacterized protein GlcG (DUF336 family)